MKTVCYLNPMKPNAVKVLGAFAHGSGAEMSSDGRFHRKAQSVFYGVEDSTLALYNNVIDGSLPFLYIDNGYFGSKWQGGDYYRITRNREQHTGYGVSDGVRFRNLGIKIQPWKKTGAHVLVACQSDYWHQRHSGETAEEWGRRIAAEVAQFTDRKIIIRGKPIGGHKEPPLLEHISGAWATVTYSSMVSLEGLMMGIPAFATTSGSMDLLALRDLSMIETPLYSDAREDVACVLADNQWALSEFRDGTAWRMLNK